MPMPLDPNEIKLTPPVQSPWLLVANWFGGLICIGVVVAVVLNIGDLAHLIAVLRGIEPRWLILAVASQSLTYVAAASIWQRVLKASAQSVPFLALYRLSLAQLCAEQVLPSSGLSGALLVVKGLVNRGIAETIGMACMLVGMVSYYAAYLVAILASFAILIATHDLRDPKMLILIMPLIGIVCIFCLVVGLVLSGVFWLRRRGRDARLPAWLQRRLRHWPLANRLLQILVAAPSHLLQNRSLLLHAASLQLLVFLIDAVTLSLMLQAIGLGLRYDIVFACFVLALVVGAVLPVPLGLGSFEASCVALLHLFQVPIEAGLVAVLLLRGFTFWLPMLPGLILVRHELRTAPPSP
jgi:uncharacterized protein (TIRG00374 family)